MQIGLARLGGIRLDSNGAPSQQGSDVIRQSTGVLRNKVNIQLRRGKANFFHSGFEDCAKSKNIKKSWSLINWHQK